MQINSCNNMTTDTVKSVNNVHSSAERRAVYVGSRSGPPLSSLSRESEQCGQMHPAAFWLLLGLLYSVNTPEGNSLHSWDHESWSLSLVLPSYPMHFSCCLHVSVCVLCLAWHTPAAECFPFVAQRRTWDFKCLAPCERTEELRSPSCLTKGPLDSFVTSFTRKALFEAQSLTSLSFVLSQRAAWQVYLDWEHLGGVNMLQRARCCSQECSSDCQALKKVEP